MRRNVAILCLKTACWLMVFLACRELRSQEGPVFRVSPPTGRSTFQVGERIPFELSFSSLIPERFEINLAGYDRSGRMSEERFEVSPGAGWADPLARYFAGGPGMMGGLSISAVLTPTPTVLSLDLNEWIRFDAPGTYRVTVSSGWLTDLTDKQRFRGEHPLQVRAKAVELHLVRATPEWQAATLRRALAQLDAAPPGQGILPEATKAAIADLRFLGTAGSIRALAANVREDRLAVMYSSGFGLMGVSEAMRDTAAGALEAKIDDPLFPVCGWLIETLSILKAKGEATAGALDEGRLRARQEIWRTVLGALPRKVGMARAATAQTLLSNPPDDLDAGDKAALGKVLAASFLDLSEDRRTAALLRQWDLLRSASMLPMLQTSARLAMTRPGSNEMGLYTRRELKSAALARWYELNPEGATREVLVQIGSANPSLTAQDLWFLPEQRLPQFEPVWAARLAESDDYQEETVLGGLLVRFGTGAATRQVAGKLRAKVGAWACAPQAAALGYLVKFDAEKARPFLQEAVAASGAGKTGCARELFQDVSEHASGAVLTDVAVALLNGADARIGMDALMYLAGHGRAEDRQAIWERYVKWSEEWSGKAEVLDSPDRTVRERVYPEIGLGENLAHALIANQGWLADADLIARVSAMCVGQQVCGQVRQTAARAAPPYHVNVSRFGGRENFEVGQYSAKSLVLLEQKIVQYPRGTIFDLSHSSPGSEDQRALEKEVEAIFTKEGMVLKAN